MNRREAEELLPWFVAGTLSAEETQAVQAFIDNGEFSEEELSSLALFADTIAEKAADEPDYNPDILHRAMQQIDAVTQEQPDEPVIVREVGAKEGADRAGGSGRSGQIIQRILERLQWTLTPPLARIAIGAQFALLLGLVVALSSEVTSEREPAEYGTVSGSSVDSSGGLVVGASLSVVFAAGATELQIRELLIANRASIVAGPTALGVYTLGLIDAGQSQRTVDSLSRSPLVTLVQRVPQP